MKNENVMNAFSEMSRAEYALGNAVDDLKATQQSYKNELMNECIGNILKVQEAECKLTERDLMIFLRDLISKVSDLRLPR
nr:hypothetical protein [Mycobacterium sp. E3298]